MDRFGAMNAFTKVVETGGFSAAARRLNSSTSRVTVQVKSIEDQLGVLLLNRSTRKVSPTEIGHAYYEHCVHILSDIEDAEQIVQASQIKPRGILRLNVAQSIPAVIAGPVVEFGALYPDASVRLTVTSAMVDLIEEGFDLAIRVAPVHDSSLIRRQLATYRMVICGAPDYFARHGRPEQPADLMRHNCLFFYDAFWGKEWHFGYPEREEIVRLSGNMETNSVVALRMAAVSGQGLICAPAFMVEAELNSGQLVPVLTDVLRAEFSIDALYPNRRHLPPKVRCFIDILLKHFRAKDRSNPHESLGTENAIGVFPEMTA
ncbi:MAG TPA: LysR family transcriptional regulator [Bradyrhizobium sp.]|jgi:DNA-binding transcriptional LysR family regulator